MSSSQVSTRRLSTRLFRFPPNRHNESDLMTLNGEVCGSNLLQTMSAEADLCGAPADPMSAGVVVRQRRVQSVCRSLSSTGVKSSPRFPGLGRRRDASTRSRCGSAAGLTGAARSGFATGARPWSASRRPLVFLCQPSDSNNPHPGRPGNKVQSKEQESAAPID